MCFETCEVEVGRTLVCPSPALAPRRQHPGACRRYPATTRRQDQGPSYQPAPDSQFRTNADCDDLSGHGSHSRPHSRPHACQNSPSARISPACTLLPTTCARRTILIEATHSACNLQPDAASARGLCRRSRGSEQSLKIGAPTQGSQVRVGLEVRDLKSPWDNASL